MLLLLVPYVAFGSVMAMTAASLLQTGHGALASLSAATAGFAMAEVIRLSKARRQKKGYQRHT